MTKTNKSNMSNFERCPETGVMEMEWGGDVYSVGESGGNVVFWVFEPGPGGEHPSRWEEVPMEEVPSEVVQRFIRH